MKHKSTRELFHYWDSQRRSRALPDRTDIEPGPIRTALGDVFILTADDEAGHPFRLAGTRVCALFGRELKGEALLSLWETRAKENLRNLMATASAESLGFVAAAAGHAADGEKIALELLVLPLRHRGRTDARLMGVLAPVCGPDWQLRGSIKQLVLGSYRFLTVPTWETTPLQPLLANFRLRHGFRVYDGTGSKTAS